MNNEKKLISIIIPCLNAAKTINKTLNSLRNQTSKILNASLWMAILLMEHKKLLLNTAT